MIVLDWVTTWVLVVALFMLMRWLGTRLHRQIFKVGWLITKDLGTTTLFYYLLFLPGIVLNQFTYWLAAGIVNVSAERHLRIPEQQEAAELRHRFVRVGKKTPPFKLTFISLTPLVVTITLIWVIATRVLNVEGFTAILDEGDLSRLPEALSVLLSASDVWLWFYLIFTFGNTLLLDWKALGGARFLIVGLIAAFVFLLVIGAGAQIATLIVTGPLASAVNVLSLAFGVIIAADLLVAGVLGIFEAIYERVTGDSATYHNGKLVAMRREDILRQRQADEEKDAKRRAQRAQTSAVPSVYKLPLPLPPGPDKAPLIIKREDARILPAPAPVTPDAAPAPVADRAGASLIEGKATILKTDTPALPLDDHDDSETADG